MTDLFDAEDASNRLLQGNRLALGRNSAFMDSCQLIRKETKMEVAHFNQKQLAARWSISEATLERWRSEGMGPKFLKLCGRVRVPAGSCGKI
jgi:hypothetical protein